jgi:hypothetical protein
MDARHADAGGREGAPLPTDQTLQLHGWLELELPGSPTSGTADGFSARGQVSPFGGVRLVFSDIAGPRDERCGWVTFVAESGDSLYGSGREAGPLLTVAVDGGTGALDGASGWVRVSRSDRGTSACGVDGEIHIGQRGPTTEAPPPHHRRLGTWKRGRERTAGGAGT